MNRRAGWISAALLLTGAVAAQPPQSPSPERTIAFANHGGIFDWRADGERGLWVQDIHKQWYYAKLMAPCTGLNFATALAFDTRPSDQFDRFSFIRVPHQGLGGRCAVVSLTASDAPPTKRKPAAPAAPPPAGTTH